jgi:hypothetical protein
VASPVDRPEVDVRHEVPTARCCKRDPSVGRADGVGESDLGLHTDSGRAAERRPSCGPLDHSPDPEGGGPAAGAAAADVMADVSQSTLERNCQSGFFTTEGWTWRGLVTYDTAFAIDVASRRVQILGSTPNPEALFMHQIVRTLTMADGGAVCASQVLICDRDRKWSDDVRHRLGDAGIRVVLPRRVRRMRTPMLSASCGRSKTNAFTD